MSRSNHAYQRTGLSPAPPEGHELLAFFEQSHRFVQQSTRVHSVETAGSQRIVNLQLLGDPISAEFRECYRVSAAIAKIQAKVGETDQCAVVNVSSVGFALISRTRYRVGEVVSIILDYRGHFFRGTACVQGCKPLQTGSTRYGLSVNRDAGEHNLSQGLPLIAAKLQQEQLARLSGHT